MDEKIKKLRYMFNELFDKNIYSNSYIEILDQDTLIITANEVGFLYLINKMIDLCEKKSDYGHYHLDEAGMIDVCEREIVIKYTNPRWQKEHTTKASEVKN